MIQCRPSPKAARPVSLSTASNDKLLRVALGDRGGTRGLNVIVGNWTLQSSLAPGPGNPRSDNSDLPEEAECLIVEAYTIGPEQLRPGLLILNRVR